MIQIQHSHEQAGCTFQQVWYTIFYEPAAWGVSEDSRLSWVQGLPHPVCRLNIDEPELKIDLRRRPDRGSLLPRFGEPMA